MILCDTGPLVAAFNQADSDEAVSRRAACWKRSLMRRAVLGLSAGSHGVYPVPDAVDDRRMSRKRPGAVSQDVQVDQACSD